MRTFEGYHGATSLARAQVVIRIPIPSTQEAYSSSKATRLKACTGSYALSVRVTRAFLNPHDDRPGMQLLS